MELMELAARQADEHGKAELYGTLCLAAIMACIVCLWAIVEPRHNPAVSQPAALNIKKG